MFDIEGFKYRYGITSHVNVDNEGYPMYSSFRRDFIHTLESVDSDDIEHLINLIIQQE